MKKLGLYYKNKNGEDRKLLWGTETAEEKQWTIDTLKKQGAYDIKTI